MKTRVLKIIIQALKWVSLAVILPAVWCCKQLFRVEQIFLKNWSNKHIKDHLCFLQQQAVFTRTAHVLFAKVSAVGCSYTEFRKELRIIQDFLVSASLGTSRAILIKSYFSPSTNPEIVLALTKHLDAIDYEHGIFLASPRNFHGGKLLSTPLLQTVEYTSPQYYLESKHLALRSWWSQVRLFPYMKK